MKRRLRRPPHTSAESRLGLPFRFFPIACHFGKIPRMEGDPAGRERPEPFQRPEKEMPGQVLICQLPHRRMIRPAGQRIACIQLFRRSPEDLSGSRGSDALRTSFSKTHTNIPPPAQRAAYIPLFGIGGIILSPAGSAPDRAAQNPAGAQRLSALCSE